MTEQGVTTTQHTPGPWRIYEGPIAVDRGLNPFYRGIVAHLGHELAIIVDEREGLSTAYTQNECKANAHLIATAPELLAVLVAAVETGRMRPFANEDSYFWDAWLPRAEAAIAKARGEA